MKKLFLLSLFLSAPCFANGVPTWTTGSSNRTENTTQTITRSIVTEKYGSALNSWEASNISVAASAGIAGGDAVFTVADTSADWSLQVTTRAAGALTEQITQNDTITTTSVITSLSVFSQ
jgi:PKD repeat protein